MADREVAEADFLQGEEGLGKKGDGAEKVEGAIDGEVENIGDGVTAVGDGEGFAVIAKACAGGARGDGFGKKLELDGNFSMA